ncbi:Tyrosine recombinase XerC [Caulifigura coniformis]|uniref:Tyrosine recombinase XerC n=1 Tax=Caulifigura coniformis TaxID=2527983 RepID=A0A517SMD6_9PLAN|nr:tyrosine-type recombinase/integrase [Caulifigura coniformis]QDT57293.1 Tyrosine recombinase XerC [Caulifigura coniformis]
MEAIDLQDLCSAATASLDAPARSELEVAWTTWIETKAKAKRDRSYIATLRSTMKEFLRVSKARTFSDLHPRQLRAYLKAREAKGTYSRSYLRGQIKSIQAFVRSVAEDLDVEDPFARFDLRRLPEVGRRGKSVERRMLLLDEWEYLRRHMFEQNATRRRLTAEMRILLYTVALQTGYRAVECSRLRVMDLHVEGGKTSLELSGKGAQRTKNGKPARQYIKPDLADCIDGMIRRRWDDVMPWLRRRDSKIFPAGLRTWQNIAAVLRQDLSAARVAYREQRAKEGQPFDPDFLTAVDSEGRVVDFHALRYTCGAWLVHLNTDIKTVQKIMRHGTITLTLDTYGHMYPGNDWAAVLKMPDTL